MAGHDDFTLRLTGDLVAAATARRALGSLHPGFDDATLETMQLLVTELVTNSVRHAQARFVSVRAAVNGSAVWLEVADEGPGFDPGAAMQRGARSEESGWGLMLVDRLADRWGVERDADSTRVWFELER